MFSSNFDALNYSSVKMRSRGRGLLSVGGDVIEGDMADVGEIVGGVDGSHGVVWAGGWGEGGGGQRDMERAREMGNNTLSEFKCKVASARFEQEAVPTAPNIAKGLLLVYVQLDQVCRENALCQAHRSAVPHQGLSSPVRNCCFSSQLCFCPRSRPLFTDPSLQLHPLHPLSGLIVSR
jgi:hypothetical protein